MRARLLLVALGTAALLPTAPARACAQAASVLDVPTFAVSVSAEHPSYRRGQLVTVVVEVHRLTPAGPRVAGAEVTVVVSSGDRIVKQLYGTSDTTGASRRSWRLTTRTPAGRLTAVATASLMVVNGSDCTGGLVYESGRGTANPLLTVTS